MPPLAKSFGVQLGFGSDGQPLENPTGGAAYYDQLRFAEYAHDTEDHVNGTLVESLSYGVELDTDHASRTRFVNQNGRVMVKHAWGQKHNTEHRSGYARQYGGGGYQDLTPSYDAWPEPDAGSYDNVTQAMEPAWLYHPDSDRSPLYRGLAIHPTTRAAAKGSSNLWTVGSPPRRECHQCVVPALRRAGRTPDESSCCDRHGRAGCR